MKKTIFFFVIMNMFCVTIAIAQCTGYNLDFDGSNDYVNTNQVLMGTDSGAVEAWIKSESISNDQTIVMRGWTTGNAATWFTLRSTGKVQLQHYDGSWHTVTSLTTLSAGTWYHVSATWGSLGMNIYINGCLEATNSYTGRGYNSNSGITTTIGEWKDQLGSTYGFNGLIDDVRIWNKQIGQPTIQTWMTRPLTSSHPKYSGLTGYFKFDEGTGGAGATTDNAASATDGTLGQTSQSYHPSWVSSTGMYELSSSYISPVNGLDFDGIDDYVTTNLNLINTSSGAIEAWINPASIPTSTSAVIIGRPYTNQNMGTWLVLKSDGKVQLELFDSGSSTFKLVTSTSILVTGKWYHVAATWGGNGMKIYINGCEEAVNSSWTSGGASSGNNAVIGEWTDQLGGAYGFDGQMDEVRTWSVQVSQSNIQDWMNKTLTSSHPDYSNGLTGYFEFDEGSGGAGATTDNAVNATDGTLGQTSQSYHPSWITSAAQINYGCSSPRLAMGINTEENEWENSFTIFPNPLKRADILNVSILQSENFSVELFDINGRQIERKELNAGQHTVQFDITGLGLASGIYICKMTSQFGIKVKKIAIN